MAKGASSGDAGESQQPHTTDAQRRRSGPIRIIISLLVPSGNLFTCVCSFKAAYSSVTIYESKLIKIFVTLIVAI